MTENSTQSNGHQSAQKPLLDFWFGWIEESQEPTRVWIDSMKGGSDLAGLGHLLVSQEPILLDVGQRRGDQRDLRVAVEEHLLHVITELQVLDRLLLGGELLVPAGLADRGSHRDEVHDARVVAQEMRMAVDDELRRQPLGALGGQPNLLLWETALAGFGFLVGAAGLTGRLGRRVLEAE